MSWSHAQAAAVMGMPEHEILAVAEVGDVHVVTTHDGQHTVVTADGRAQALKNIADQLGLSPEEAEAAAAELAAMAAEADPLKVDPQSAQRAGLDPNAAEIAQGARAAHENPGAKPPAEPVPVANPAAGGVTEGSDGGGQSDDGGQGGDEGAGDGEPEEVPDGTADAVLDWVGDDVDRAARALAAEQDREKPRTGLVAALQKKVGDPA